MLPTYAQYFEALDDRISLTDARTLGARCKAKLPIRLVKISQIGWNGAKDWKDVVTSNLSVQPSCLEYNAQIATGGLGVPCLGSH